MIRIVESDKRVKLVFFNKLKFSMKKNVYSYLIKLFTPPPTSKIAKKGLRVRNTILLKFVER